MELKRPIELHPLFFLVGIFSAVTGKLPLFLAAVLAALEHELAHAIAARRFGYRLDKIVLMPYGAVIKGDLSGIPKREELWVILAGPLCNLLTYLGFLALWWLFPETYPYTEAAANVSFSLFAVNLLPAYPLDGGRFFSLLFRSFRKKDLFLKLLSLLCGISIALFGLLKTKRLDALLFAALLLCGNFGKASYARLTFSRNKNFRRGLEERRIAVSGELTAGDCLRFLREDKYLSLVVFEEGEFLGELFEGELLSAFERGDYGATLKSLISI